MGKLRAPATSRYALGEAVLPMDPGLCRRPSQPRCVTTWHGFVRLARDTLRSRLKRAYALHHWSGAALCLPVFGLLLIAWLAASAIGPSSEHAFVKLAADPSVHTRGAPADLLPVPSRSVKPGVSLVASCMNRHAALNETLPTWIALPHVDEIIIVDWSSAPPLRGTIEAVTVDRRVKVIRVENEPQWVLSRAFNLGVAASSREDIIRTDCDYSFRSGFVRAHRLGVSHRRTNDLGPDDRPLRTAKMSWFYAGNYSMARNDNEVHLNGAVFLRRRDFIHVGGYDERIQTYGWDDEDLYGRLGKAGVEKRNINYDYLNHVAHSDSSRVQKKVTFPQVEIDFNQLLLEHLPQWSAALAQLESSENSSSTYRILHHSTSSSFLSVVALRAPRSVQALVDEMEAKNDLDLALGRRLNNDYHVPWDIMATMEASLKKQLLVNLKVAAANSSSRRTPRIVFAHVQHGLGNRLRALASAMAFAKNTKRVLILIWETDAHISAQFGELFESNLVVMSKFKPKWPFTDFYKWDKAWRDVLPFNYIEMDGNGAVKDAYISANLDKHIYFKSSCIMQTDSALSNWEKDNEMLRSLRPVRAVIDAVNNHVVQNGLNSRIGLHIRDRTLARDIKNVDFNKEYGNTASQTMDYWRRKSSYKSFATEMSKLLKNDSSLKFYVATDTRAVIDELNRLFPGKILCTPRDCDGRDGRCVQFALIDILCLAKTRKLYGSNWSSFTEAAERFGNLKALLAGQDFARDSSHSK